MKTTSVDVLVIGAGPAGSVASSIINKSGLKVRMVEKEKFPRFVIGESLLPRSMEALEEANLLDAIKEQGFQQKFGAKFVRGNDVCDFKFSEQFTKGWEWTWQVPRADFDMTIARAAQKQGVQLDFETTVTDIKFYGTDSVTTVVDKNGVEEQIKARFIVDASGYGRVIPRLFNLDKQSNMPTRKTVFTHVKDPDRLNFDDPNRITIIVHKPGVWVWAIPFSNGNTSVGFVGDEAFFEATNHLSKEEQLRFLINSEVNAKERFGDKEFVFEPRTIQGWSVTTNKFYGDGFVLTGNVTEFLDPVFSSGVTLAVSSSQRAANLVVKQLQGTKVDWEEEFMKPTNIGVDTFRSYVMAWYDGTLSEIFFAKDVRPEFKKQICSVLAGYVWDLDNPFVKKHDRALKALADVIRLNKAEQTTS
ncbi:MAG: NAD(P)/FAD-dependent oxidoreductase [Bacteroidia bacterium]